MADEGNVDPASASSSMEIWQEGSVVVFDANLALQNPIVKGTGGAGIILLY